MTQLDQGYVRFTIESRILKELGERLVSDAPVALTELVKNSHDADATECKVVVSKNLIKVSDNGHGMSFNEFENRWMTIATHNKAKSQYSRKFHRKLTGSKGIGRFAVRFLGDHLTLESITQTSSGRTKLTAYFDWKELDKQLNILELEVPYTLETTQEDCGTHLTISNLRAKVDDNQLKKVKGNVLSDTSPIYALIDDAPNYGKDGLLASLQKNNVDPGFKVVFSDLKNYSEEAEEENLATKVLKNFVLRAQLIVQGNQLNISIEHSNSEVAAIEPLSIPINNVMGTDIYADIRFFPRRAGVFNNKGINGKLAWQWVRINSGIKVYDHGFGISPYGYEDDDWLWLNLDTAHSSRHWRSDLMKEFFPMDPEIAKSPKLNPMVGIPTNYQVVGAVFVQSSASGDDNDVALVPSMDRQGFVSNAAFEQLRGITRFGVELIAHYDKYIIRELEKKYRNLLYAEQRDEIDAVVREIRASATLIPEDKERIIEHYSRIKDNVEELGDYDKDARQNLEVMSLLGVVAGFMTHEYQAALMELEEATSLLKSLIKFNPDFGQYAKKLDKTIENFNGYIEYTRLFVENIHLPKVEAYYVFPVVENVISTFKRFQEERNISVDLSLISEDLYAPLIPVAMYQGIILNLYTNALKALLNEKSPNKKIVIQAWNESKKHILQVLDNGPGIPDEVKNRIWDPLYTTTSSENNPLGSGMGLGLPLVRKVIEGRKGKINLISPPPGFSTCFRVELPL